jgi:hypothetical protein
MTASSFGWLAHDDGERRRMMEVIDLFRERGTLDELGIGTIRDTFAEHFFPGTSTIQTRARYFLFIPWMYRQLEEERVPSSRAGRRARELHTQLVTSLKKGGVGASAGLIGIDAGDALQRLPSAIYWYGLGRWGTFTRSSISSTSQSGVKTSPWSATRCRDLICPRSGVGRVMNVALRAPFAGSLVEPIGHREWRVGLQLAQTDCMWPGATSRRAAPPS